MNSEKILSETKDLPYNERQAYAGKLAKELKGKPELAQLIKDLQTVIFLWIHFQYPPPSAPEMEVEEGFVEVLPAQKLNLNKYYTQEQIVMVMAASGEDISTLKSSFISPSKFFKKFSARKLAKLIKS